jgi:pseudouridine kinase
VAVIGGANMDVKSRLTGPAAMGGSNPAAAMLAPGGVARNIAHNLALFGRPVKLFSAIGQDALGERLAAECAAAGIDIHGVSRLPEPTGIYSAILDEGGELILASAAMAIMERLTPEYLAAHERAIGGARLIVADDNLPAASLDWLWDLAARRGRALAIEAVSPPKAGKIAALLEQRRPLHALFCNRDELAAIAGRAAGETADLTPALRDLHGRGVRHIAVGLGRAGALVSSRMDYGIAHRLVPAIPGAVVDVTGAGDAAVAGTLHGLLDGLDLVRAATLGQAAAALTVRSPYSVDPALSAARVERLRRAHYDRPTER